MTDGQIPRAAGTGGQRDADERGAHTTWAIADDAHCKPARTFELGDEGSQRNIRPNNRVVCTDSVRGRRELRDERSEAERREQLEALLAVGAAIVETRDVHLRQRHVGTYS